MVAERILDRLGGGGEPHGVATEEVGDGVGGVPEPAGVLAELVPLLE